MSKETFIIRTEWYEAISELDDKDQATILRNLFLYHLGDINEMVLDTFGAKIVWKLIEPTLSRNIESYDKRRESAIDNGKLGGRPEGKNIITDLSGNPIPSKEHGKHYFYIIYDHDLKIYKIGNQCGLVIFYFLGLLVVYLERDGQVFAYITSWKGATFLVLYTVWLLGFMLIVERLVYKMYGKHVNRLKQLLADFDKSVEE